ncbi:MAG: serine dehydratase [bacterium]|nr:serine dehydratase [bacterium]
MKQFPSIFNDVIGPVMRGPSSSHCAAAARIGLLARALMGNKIESVLVEFDSRGSLPRTHESQGSDMGLLGGLLGFEPFDKRLVDYREEIRQAGIQVQFKTGSYGDPHPNTYRLSLKNSKEDHALVAVSTGGGMIDVIEIDGHELSLLGDLYVTLIYFEQNETGDIRRIEEILGQKCDIRILKAPKKEKRFICLKTHAPLDKSQIAALALEDETIAIKFLPPVLPILTAPEMEVPFGTCEQMLAYNRNRQLSLAELAIEYESARGGVGRDEILDKMVEIVRIMKNSVRIGLSGTHYKDRILGCQSIFYKKKHQAGQLLDIGILNRIILYVTALMETKSAMGVIVAAPTAGSCGGLPGTVLGAADVMGCDDKQIAKAMLAAGMIGVFISKFSTFAAEVAGCQAECGAGSGMAAAALAALMGAEAEVAIAGASMALQNSLGMICDPVANRVEVPCLGKNVMAASNAVSCANMALAGYDPVIPLDEVLHTMDDVGKSIPAKLRCTALGGLSVTPTSKKIKEKLEGNFD